VAWYWWVLTWVVLVIVAAGVLFLLGRSLWGKAKVLLTELTTASDRLTAVSDGLQQLSEKAAEPAVFTPAAQLRQERVLAGRRRQRR
jgi:hypothetical protein